MLSLKRLSLPAALILLASAAVAQDTLVTFGSDWKYLDNGSNQGTAWTDPLFNDLSWALGPAQLGYGDGDEATVVSFGPSSSNKFRTTYFRHEFNVVDHSIYVSLDLRLVRDDGAVVYLNGTEIARINMPAASHFLSFASSTIDREAEDTPEVLCVAPNDLVTGTNLLAVEIHQRSSSSSDISFDLQLVADTGLVAKRGPYLQKGGADQVTVRWNTNLPSDQRVWFGPAPGSLTNFVDSPSVGLSHEILLTGLMPDTVYFYAVGSTSQMIAGADVNHFFLTSPTVGTAKSTRLWVIGDAGTASAEQRAVRDAYYAFTGATHTDLWLMLGDNAYLTGTDSQYQVAVFDMYEELLRKSVVWSTRGNHETSALTYQSLFTFPIAGEVGGVPSGTEAYYSFDYANIHFICLDSQGSNRNVGGAMWNWVSSDLAATNQQWIIAFWHHPPYTRGSHNSDAEFQLVQMRQNFNPLLEAGGVDLVLSGHSHSYERSMLLSGHYGNAATLTPEMVLDSGDGRPTGDGAYTQLQGPGAGTVYTVAGSSGKTSFGSLNHNAMFVSLRRLASVVLDIDGDSIDLTTIDENGVVLDSFRLEEASIGFCNGDGGDQLGCTNCPCMNDAPLGTIGGCLNSVSTSAKLIASGNASISLPSGSAVDLRFDLTGAPPSAFCLLVSGDALAPGNTSNPCFGMDSGLQSLNYDGLRCAILNTRRHGGRSADVNGEVGFTNNGWGGANAPNAGLVQQAGFVSGQTRFFQAINRDNPTLACMRGLNSSQALEIRFTP